MGVPIRYLELSLNLLYLTAKTKCGQVTNDKNARKILNIMQQKLLYNFEKLFLIR